MTTYRAPDFDLTKPGKLIAAVPAVLGFVPEKSLVLVTLDRGELGCVMRIDLSAEVLDAVDHLAEVAATSRPNAAVAVIVDEDGAACRMCTDEHRQLAEVLSFVLKERDVALLAVYVVDQIAEGGSWHGIDEQGGSGRVEDPRSSPMAVAAVLDGRPLYRGRAEVQAVIAVTDPDRTAALGPVMERAGHDGGLRDEPDAREDVEHALAMIRAVDRGCLPDDEDLVRLGCGLTDPRVRDTLYALAVGRDADRAESLWASLARTLPDPWRAEALVLLAFSAYARGDGPLAGIALEAALTGNAGHRMAGMLDQALQSGMRPDQIRELAQTGYRLAKRLGVRLPPRRMVGKRAG